MEDVELVIKIPKKEFGIEIDDKFQDFFKRLKAEIKERLMSGTALVCGAYELETIEMLLNAFANATPLPKGHGRLIDADDAKSYFSDREGDDFTAFHFYDAVESTPTIIEADNLENEEHEHMTADELAELFTESGEGKE